MKLLGQAAILLFALVLASVSDAAEIYLSPGVQDMDHQTLKAKCIEGKSGDEPCYRLVFEWNGKVIGHDFTNNDILHLLPSDLATQYGKNLEWSGRGFRGAIRIRRFPATAEHARYLGRHTTLFKEPAHFSEMSPYQRVAAYLKTDPLRINYFDHMEAVIVTSRFRNSWTDYQLVRIEHKPWQKTYDFIYVNKKSLGHYAEFENKQAAKAAVKVLDPLLNSIINSSQRDPVAAPAEAIQTLVSIIQSK